MIAISTNLLALSEYGPQLSRLTPIITEAVEGPATGGQPIPLRGAVSVQDVEFGYDRDRTPLFRGLSFDVAPGEFIALVGRSGSGKSSIVRLLLGFEEPWSGTVAYDGADLARLDPSSVRRQIGAVLQSSRPIGRTIRECILGPRRLDDRALASVIAACGLTDDLEALPRGLDTPLGEAGVELSGGQRQRVMLAAALAGDPAILLLDEATSALDNVTQEIVMRTVRGSSATRIVIAHRLSTVREADRVLVVAGGAIVESGPPEQLLASGGMFAQLAARQEL
jgi:ABC-type bacteriocin/lantibiotic exporter with double-glycine peptidase domain